MPFARPQILYMADGGQVGSGLDRAFLLAWCSLRRPREPPFTSMLPGRLPPVPCLSPTYQTGRRGAVVLAHIRLSNCFFIPRPFLLFAFLYRSKVPLEDRQD